MNHLEAARELGDLVAAYEPKFLALAEEAVSRPAAPGKWSRKQILGHLIDSAANNHQRFIRLQTTAELHFPATSRTTGCDSTTTRCGPGAILSRCGRPTTGTWRS